MKYISFAIPAYNSEAYLAHALDTLLAGGEDVEIIVINDGSQDGTLELAQQYAAEHPKIVRVVDKPNGGHGSGVNRGLAEAQGMYYKVIDSDDWVDEQALRELILTLKGHVSKGLAADLYFTNYVYDHSLEGKRFVRGWKKQFPVRRFFSWEEAGSFRGSEVMMMHSLLYKTELLRACGLKLPEHTFYVDNIYAYQPLPYAKRLFYLDVDLYHYFIGRADQSVTFANMTKRYAQQNRVMQCMTDAYSYAEIEAMTPGLRKYMLHCLSAIMVTTMMFSCSGGADPERKQAYAALWAHIQERDPALYGFLLHKGLPAIVAWLPWKARGTVMRWCYWLLCKTVKLG